METNLPIYEIRDVPFYVDVDNNRLFQKGNEDNVLRFDDMEYCPTGYVARINPECMSQANHFSKQIVEEPIEHMVKLDPERMAKKYGTSVDKLPVSDGLLTYNKDNLVRRVMGELPRMMIYGHEFIIDLRLGLLRPVDDFRTMGIVIDELLMDASGSVYQCLYDFNMHTIAIPDMSITSIPKNIIPIEIPNDDTLDPFFCAKKYSELNGLSRQYPIGKAEVANAIDWEKTEMSQYFSRYPVRFNLEARIIPWERTGVMEVIKKNRDFQKKNMPRKRKGKGL
ncbi:hypothetical protein [Chitinophaga polysaccharea]|uniref:hypothetical protein n=1 Tax=Chitinophaga polysaccharea TaxID=1293035 RepID=UPI001159DF09|nr:hypothetical protein [Chitinophaga polysaccharea]